jgi:hypothetical protein
MTPHQLQLIAIISHIILKIKFDLDILFLLFNFNKNPHMKSDDKVCYKFQNT